MLITDILITEFRHTDGCSSSSHKHDYAGGQRWHWINADAIKAHTKKRISHFNYSDEAYEIRCKRNLDNGSAKQEDL